MIHFPLTKEAAKLNTDKHDFSLSHVDEHDPTTTKYLKKKFGHDGRNISWIATHKINNKTHEMEALRSTDLEQAKKEYFRYIHKKIGKSPTKEAGLKDIALAALL